ncbi:MerR family transcriptional regulator [Neolewinella agarilytica]|uniref:Homeodomain-like domain-containing protein n=1 Tax=Neolewinella agarilytica TaxID=478744 RepID=A0A1H9LXQ9_9BACT|nr:hypothetical protein [Neolewinella agarilytica]SER15977.1 hypothetical protein SAMN05444359_12618 [Neolewinella agarilytica]
MFLFILLYLVVYVTILTWTFTKAEIAQEYGVTRPTLRKWIRYFSSRTDYETWKRRRKFSGKEVLSLICELGWPNSTNCLTKGQIKEQCETEYQTITDMVQLNAAKLGIDINAYRNVDIFPPSLSQRIVAVMG